MLDKNSVVAIFDQHSHAEEAANNSSRPASI